MLELYYRFIRFSLGVYEGMEFLEGAALRGFDWKKLYAFSVKQKLVGVVMEGISKLPKEVAPDGALLMKWFAESQKIRRQNVTMNKVTAGVYDKVAAAGFRCCILKGQGNALMYPEPQVRMSGDVDVWVEAPREEVRRIAVMLAKDNGGVGEESLNHIVLKVDGIAVELHSTPAILNNPVHNYRLQLWLRRNADQQFCNLVTLPNVGEPVAVPTNAFNVVYQLFHLYHHYFYEGVGLRQVIDYFFVIRNYEEEFRNYELGVRNSESNNSKSQAKPRTNPDSKLLIPNSLKRFGLCSFAGAVMYVLHEVMGLSENSMIVPMDGCRVRMLLDDVLRGGNFGQYADRRPHTNGFISHNLQRLQRDLRLLRFYPQEALSEPFYRLWHWCWRKNPSSPSHRCQSL